MAEPIAPNWEPSNSITPLVERHVHVWRAELDVESARIEQHALTLSADEERRVAHFKDAINRQRFVAAHGILRTILAGYAQLDPANVLIEADVQGKPSLLDIPACIEFSLAHSGPLALIAVAQGQACGIDVEAVRDLPERMDIAARTLTASEFAHFSQLSLADQVARFYRYWTAKEAALKALGLGLSYDLRRMAVDLDRMPFARASQTDGEHQWTVVEFRPASEFWGALAVERAPEQIHFLDWFPQQRE